jgi:quercetin dioxygenase-like cupin family protein
VLAIDVLGPVVEDLTVLGAVDDEPCVMRGTIPPNVGVPMHSHLTRDVPAAFRGARGPRRVARGLRTVAVGPGDVFHVPGNARHGLRHATRERVVMHLVSTARVGRFFHELGVPVRDGRTTASPPSDEAIARFLTVAER